MKIPWGIQPEAAKPEADFHRVIILKWGFEEENMKKYVLLLLITLSVTACTSGKTEFFPSRGQSDDVAEVTVVRQKRMIGLGFAMDVLLDGDVIARLKAGQYVTFFVNPGVHDIGIPNSSITVALERARKHYFAIMTDSSQFGFEIERISERKATSWMAGARSIK